MRNRRNDERTVTLKAERVGHTGDPATVFNCHDALLEKVPATGFDSG